MRIIAGEFRHRKLFSPPDNVTTRPIPDRVKEAVFNLLRGWTDGAVFLDVFAGTGAIGLEAVSRGAARCVFFEKDRRIGEILQKNIDSLGCTDRCELIRADALSPALLTRGPRDTDIVFFDPPYALIQDRAGWERVKLQFGRVIGPGGLLKPNCFGILRTPWPFRHRIVEDGEEVATEDGGDERGKRGHPRHDRRRRRDEEDLGRERVWEGEDLRRLEADDYAEAMEGLDGEGDDGDFENEEELDFHGGESDQDSETDVELDEHAGEEASPSPARYEMVDLTFPGIEGPETHIYGSTAVHFYMRKNSTAD